MKKLAFKIQMVVQAIVGIVFAGIGLVFPFYVYDKYGFSYQNVYEKGSSRVIGHVVYFWVGLAFGIAFIGAGVWAIAVARKYLKMYR